MKLPKRTTKSDRSVQFNFRLTEAERAKLSRKAAAQGYEHLSEFVRDCLIQMGAM